MKLNSQKRAQEKIKQYFFLLQEIDANNRECAINFHIIFNRFCFVFLLSASSFSTFSADFRFFASVAVTLAEFGVVTSARRIS